MEIKGTLYNIGATTSREYQGKTYKERTVVIQVDEQYNGTTYSQYLPVVAKRDGVIGAIDSMAIGSTVTAQINLRGVKYNKDGQERFFSSIEAYRLDAESAGVAVASAKVNSYASPAQAPMLDGSDSLPF
jgi:hypothetical protein